MALQAAAAKERKEREVNDGRQATRPSAALFTLLYAAEGAPIGLIWWALPVWMRMDGVASADIARAMSWVAWPWALKFLWAPLVDLMRTERFGLVGWIVTSQLAMAATLTPLLFMDMVASIEVVVTLLVGHAVAASIQDASIDTLAIHTIAEERRGVLNGWMQVGLLGARGVFGGGAVLAAVHVGRDAVVGVMLFVILAVALAVRRTTRGIGVPPRTPWPTYREAISTMVKRREMWLGFFVAATVGAGFESLASMGGPLLIDRGASEDTTGFFFLAPAVVAMALGALVGGRFADRIGRRRAAMITQGLAAGLVITIGVATWRLPLAIGAGPYLALLGALYLAAGAATAALYSALMDLVDARAAGLQFCVFMAGINVCYVWSTRTLASIMEAHDLGTALTVLGGCSLAALPLINLLEPRKLVPVASA